MWHQIVTTVTLILMVESYCIDGIIQESFYSVSKGHTVRSNFTELGDEKSETALNCVQICIHTEKCLAADHNFSGQRCRMYERFLGYDEGELTNSALVLRGSCPHGGMGTTYGPLGTESGVGNLQSDEEYFRSHGCVTAFRSWTSTDNPRFVSGFQMRYGALWAPVIGYSGSSTDFKEILLKPGEYIATIEYFAGNVLDHVQFYSQTGRDLGDHGISSGISTASLDLVSNSSRESNTDQSNSASSTSTSRKLPDKSL